MSRVESCRDCGRLFGFLARGICGDCLDLRERQFQDVKAWLHENAGATIWAASEATQVPEARIADFIREGRLELVGAGGPTAQEIQEEEERRARLLRQIAASASFGTSVAVESPARQSAGMRSRHP